MSKRLSRLGGMINKQSDFGLIFKLTGMLRQEL